MEQIETEREFQIDGVLYRLEPLTWQQNKWLGDYIFKDVDLVALDYGTIHDLLREKGPLFMAICLIKNGMSRKEHSKLPWQEILKRAEEFAAVLTGEEVAQFGPRFFIFNPPKQMAMLVSGKILVKQIEGLQSDAPGANGSKEVLSPLPMATLPSSTSSLASGAPESPKPSSSDASSDDKSTGPSLAGSGSSSRGQKPSS